jgi:phospholipid transport system substrate-binding protein
LDSFFLRGIKVVLKMKLAACCLIGLLLGTGPAQACDAENFVLSAGRAFTVASHRGSPSAFSSAASSYADMRSIALFALGPHRKKLPPSKEGEFVRMAQGFMGRFMSRYASRFDAAGMHITSCSGNIVNAQAGGRKLIFRVAKRGGGYVLQDVNVSSIWLAGQMRSTFTGVINRNGGDFNALWDYLKS